MQKRLAIKSKDPRAKSTAQIAQSAPAKSDKTANSENHRRPQRSSAATTRKYSLQVAPGRLAWLRGNAVADPTLAYCPDGLKCPWRLPRFPYAMELQQESRRGASFAECRGVNPNRSRLSRLARCLTSAAARPHTQAVLQGAFILAKAKGAPRSPTPVSITCAAISSFCFNPQCTKEGNHHEHKRDISRGFSRQQDQPAHGGLERAPRGGTAREDARRNRAASHEAAAKLFEKHPHFTNFPGECIEIMPVLPIPGA